MSEDPQMFLAGVLSLLVSAVIGVQNNKVYNIRVNKRVVQENVVGGTSIIGFPLVIAVSEQDIPGIEPGKLRWQTSALTNELQEVLLGLHNM